MGSILAICGTLLAALNLHFFWTYKLKTKPWGYTCSSLSDIYGDFLSYQWPWINLAFFSLIPFIILISTSLAIIGKIVHSNYERRRDLHQNEAVKLTNVTLTLLCVSFLFVLTTSPVVIYRYVIT